MSRSVLGRAVLLIAVVSVLATTGCASQVGTRSSWELWNTGKRADGLQGLGKTLKLSRGFNDFSDVAATADLISKGPEGGFGIIARDFVDTVIGPWSFEELGVTFRLLR